MASVHIFQRLRKGKACLLGHMETWGAEQELGQEFPEPGFLGRTTARELREGVRLKWELPNQAPGLAASSVELEES